VPPQAHAASHAAAGTDAVTLSPSQITGTAVVTNDSRLSDARTPTAHGHTSGEVSGLGTAATKDIPATGNASATEVVYGSDTRLTDARTPSSTLTHASSHAAAGDDPVSLASSQVSGLGTAAAKDIPATGNASATEVVYGSDTRLSDSRTPSSTLTHASSHAAAGGDPLTLSPSQVTGTAVVTGDSRLSDARTPTSHKTSHATGGGDALTASDIGAAASSHTHAQSDITSLSTDLAAKAIGAASATDNTLPRFDGVGGKQLQTSSVVVDDSNNVSGVADLAVTGVLRDTTTANSQADSYTLVLADRGKMVEATKSTANNVTVPPNSDVAFPVGSRVDVLQVGAGQVTVVAGSGVTVNATPGLKLRAQWSSCTLIKRATDTWVAIGDLAA